MRACLFLLLIVATPACRCNPHLGYRKHSGSKFGDNVEQPLSDDVKKFELLLVRSNVMTDLLLNGRVADVYVDYAADSLKALATAEEIERLYAHVLLEAGPARSHKPNQWSFVVETTLDGPNVSCVKVVEHERRLAYYVFTFADEHAEKIIGLHLNLDRADNKR